MELFSLKKKTAVLFGGNGYLGRQFCRVLLQFGACVYSCDMNTDECEEIKELRIKYPGRFEFVRIDVGGKEELVQLRERIMGEKGSVDILINSITAKGKDFYQPFEEVSLEGWNIGLLGNLTIPFLTIQAFIPVMKKHQKGSIINIASHYGIVGNDQRIYEGSNLDEVYTKSSKKAKEIHSHGVYNAAKGGLINFTRYLAAYYGKDNIRVNCISPGGVYSPNENEAFLKKYSEKVPLGRKAHRDEMNGALIFLASDASSYVTGHNLVVDGGYTIW